MATCSVCDEPLVPARGAGPSTAEHGTVSGTLDDPPVWDCPVGHEHHTADATAALTEVLDALTVARRTRLKASLRCGVCDTAFPMPGRRATRSVTLVSSGVPATRVTFDLPLLRCSEDATDNLPPECVADLEAVLRQLLTP